MEVFLSSAQFDNYLTEFPRRGLTEATGCEGCVTEENIWDSLDKVEKDKILRIDGLLYCTGDCHLYFSLC